MRRGSAGTDVVSCLATGQLPVSRAAVSFAERAHAGQTRAVDGAPFIEHPLEVAELLYRAGAPDHVIAAGVLHDVVEKTAVSSAELRRRFGVEIAQIVDAVSEDERIAGYQRRKRELRERVGVAGEEALQVFAADKVSKVRELRLVPGSASAGRRRATSPQAARVAHYRACSLLLEERLAGASLVRQLRRELNALPSYVAEPEPAVSAGLRTAAA